MSTNKEIQLKNYLNIKRLIDSKEFKNLFGKQSDNKKRLILGTMMQESRFIHRFQFNDGPARGLGQVEPDTAYDVYENYLKYRDDKLQKVMKVFDNDFENRSELSKELAYNDLFNLMILRLCYYRVSEAIPTTDEGLAYYWKKYYNTHLGKGTEKEFLHSLKLLDKLDLT